MARLGGEEGGAKAGLGKLGEALAIEDVVTVHRTRTSMIGKKIRLERDSVMSPSARQDVQAAVNAFDQHIKGWAERPGNGWPVMDVNRLFKERTSAHAKTRLKRLYNTDERALVRANALAGLARMKDPATAPLSIAALEGDDEAMQGAALAALELLGDNTHSRVVLQFYERHPGHMGAAGLESLGELGDPPGSTAVRDKLLSEANKRRKFAFRYGAALGIEAMGMADLVKPILDIQNARAPTAISSS
jgi:HEAT repeat protein